MQATIQLILISLTLGSHSLATYSFTRSNLLFVLPVSGSNCSLAMDEETSMAYTTSVYPARSTMLTELQCGCYPWLLVDDIEEAMSWSSSRSRLWIDCSLKDQSSS